METKKTYKLIPNPAEARQLMKIGNYPVDIKQNRDLDSEFLPSVFVFANIEDKDFSVISNPAKARELLKDGNIMVDIKRNKNPKESDAPTVFVFEITEKFQKDIDLIKNLGGN